MPPLYVFIFHFVFWLLVIHHFKKCISDSKNQLIGGNIQYWKCVRTQEGGGIWKRTGVNRGRGSKFRVFIAYVFYVLLPLLKRICKTVGPLLVTSLEPLNHRRYFKSFLWVFGIFFGRCSSELAQRVSLPFSRRSLLVILIDCMIFLSPFFDVTRMSMSTVSFLAQLGSGILCL